MISFSGARETVKRTDLAPLIEPCILTPVQLDLAGDELQG
jgi:hypothetical protein